MPRPSVPRDELRGRIERELATGATLPVWPGVQALGCARLSVGSPMAGWLAGVRAQYPGGQARPAPSAVAQALGLTASQPGSGRRPEMISRMWEEREEHLAGPIPELLSDAINRFMAIKRHASSKRQGLLAMLPVIVVALARVRGWWWRVLGGPVSLTEKDLTFPMPSLRPPHPRARCRSYANAERDGLRVPPRCCAVRDGRRSRPTASRVRPDDPR